MKKSTRISLTVSVVWLGFTLFEMENGYRGVMSDKDASLALLLGLIVIWAVKFFLGSMIDDKED